MIAITAAATACHGKIRRRIDGRRVGGPSSLTRKVGIGSAIFFTFCSPIDSKPKASFFSTSLATFPETQMPPGSANCCNLHAMFTPSP
jgi:hypothetical protein